MILIRIISGFF